MLCLHDELLVHVPADAAPAAAEMFHLATTGLKQGAPDAPTFEKRARSFVRVFVAGLGG